MAVSGPNIALALNMSNKSLNNRTSYFRHKVGKIVTKNTFLYFCEIN